MIETTWIISAAWIALAASLIAGLVVERAWRSASPAGAAAAWTLAAFLGFFLAGLAHMLVKKETLWPPRESVHYLLFYVAPLAAAVQLIAGLPRTPGLVRLALGALLAIATPPLLLQSLIRNSWSTGETLAWCGGLAAAIGISWLLLYERPRRETPGDRGPWLVTFIAAGAAGLTLMASGSVLLGQMGLSLSLAMLGAAIASRWFRSPLRLGAGLGLAFVLLASLLIQGHLLATLSPVRAVSLGLLPIAGTAARFPALQRRGPWWPLAVQLAITAALAAVIAVPALLQAMRDAEAAGPDSYGY